MGKKLIEVAPFLPLDAISVASKADKDKKTGTIKNVHKWFAPMPTPALRALIFSAVVDAPDDDAERDRLLQLVRRLVPADGNPPDESTLNDAKREIRRSSAGGLPTIFDPFCGGGSTLIEAQRLGLPVEGSDLNPVPALITRTLTQLIPKVAGRRPVAGATDRLDDVDPLAGLVADVRHYADVVRTRVWKEAGHLYPPGPKGETVIAWLWAWTARCPNPACRATMPLVSSMWLSKRKNHTAWLVPTIDASGVRFSVGTGRGTPQPSAKVGRGAKFRCMSCGQIADDDAIKEWGLTHGLGNQLLAVAAEGSHGRVYYGDEVAPPAVDRPESAPDAELPDDPRAMWCKLYGLKTYGDQFTARQLVVLDLFAEAIADLPEQILEDGGDEAYSSAIVSILALALGKLAQANSTQVRWRLREVNSKAEPAFGRHAMPMVWDFAEVNPFGGSVGDWAVQVASVLSGIRSVVVGPPAKAVRRADARSTALELESPIVLITDPPYFDQIGYADLSDYFYVWHRRALRRVHPDLYSTIVTPKDPELIASPYRHHGDKGAAARFFVDGFTEVFRSLSSAMLEGYPTLIVYAHRQEESSSLGSASTGWDAMLEAVLAAGLSIEGTLPIWGTGSSRQIGQGTNSLASYVVMVCRPRRRDLTPGSIAEFRAALRERLPAAANALLSSGESMVDIRQAAIGPGMEVFSQFSSVFDGTNPIPVVRALTIINEELGRILDEHLGEVDSATRWACQWYSDRGYERGSYDEGRKLAQAYGLGVDGLAAAGIVEQGRGEIRLLHRGDLPAGWMGDDRVPAWEACQHLVKRLTEGSSAGEQAAAELLAALGPRAGGVRELAQFLTNLAIERGWSEEAIAFDSLVKSWPRIEQLAVHAGVPAAEQAGRLFEVED